MANGSARRCGGGGPSSPFSGMASCSRCCGGTVTVVLRSSSASTAMARSSRASRDALATSSCAARRRAARGHPRPGAAGGLAASRAGPGGAGAGRGAHAERQDRGAGRARLPARPTRQKHRGAGQSGCVETVPESAGTGEFIVAFIAPREVWPAARTPFGIKKQRHSLAEYDPLWRCAEIASSLHREMTN